MFPVKYYSKLFSGFYNVFFNSFSKIYLKLYEIFFQSSIKFLEFNLSNFFNQIMLLIISFTILFVYPISNIIINKDNLSLINKRTFYLLAKLKRRKNYKYNLIV